jgi:UDP-N-acetyl-D-glucosamine dehydrogenase
MSVDLVVIGLGYVGLPLAREATVSGLSVVGFDVVPSVVERLNSGRSHVDDLSDADVEAMVAAGFRATDDPACISDADAVVICVPTPLRIDSTPDLGAIEAATAAVGDHLSPDTLVVLESTTYPGTTNDVVRPSLEERSGLKAGIDFWLAFSPERIDPGNPAFGLRNTPKVVGGYTADCTEKAKELYSRLVDTVVPTIGTREAELAKLLENTYRHVNIALMNEMAIFCNELGIDLWAAIDAAATKPFGFQAFYPGPGVGGHCIPIDPNYLSYAVRSLGYQFRFVELAQEVSGRMPAYVASRVQRSLNDIGKPVKGSVILLLGVSYKANISDDRETPARPVARRLVELGADVRYHDPHVARFEVDEVTIEPQPDLEAAVAEADLVILLQPHDSIVGSESLDRAALILDTRGVLEGHNVERL